MSDPIMNQQDYAYIGRAVADAYKYALKREGDSSPSPLLASCRPCVQRFAIEMERQLAANDHKPGWESDTQESLLKRLDEETIELAEELYSPEREGSKVIKEAADVANFAMMIAEIERATGGCMNDIQDALQQPDSRG